MPKVSRPPSGHSRPWDGVPETSSSGDGAGDRDLENQASDDVPDHIRQSLAYVPTVARRYLGNGLDYQELIAAGNLGLVQAALRFDSSRNVSFVTYADWWIRKAIIEALEEQSRPIRLPRYFGDKLRNLERARSGWRSRFGANPTEEELALASGLSSSEIRRLAGTPRAAVSLDQPVRPSSDRPLSETLEDEGAECPQGSLIRRELVSHLYHQLAALTAREREVIRVRFGLDREPRKTLREVARKLGISRERVRQIELRVLLKLRRRLEAGGAPADDDPSG